MQNVMVDLTEEERLQRLHNVLLRVLEGKVEDLKSAGVRSCTDWRVLTSCVVPPSGGVAHSARQAGHSATTLHHRHRKNSQQAPEAPQFCHQP